jgi:hypothetical protein
MNEKEGLTELLGLGGFEVIIVSGGSSMVQVYVAGVGEVLPAASVA